jgi:hypothetical protein
VLQILFQSGNNSLVDMVLDWSNRRHNNIHLDKEDTLLDQLMLDMIQKGTLSAENSSSDIDDRLGIFQTRLNNY